MAAAYVAQDEWDARTRERREDAWRRDLAQLDAELGPLAERVEYLRRWRQVVLYGLMALANGGGR